MTSSPSIQPISNIRDYLFAEVGLREGLLPVDVLARGQGSQEEMSRFGIKAALMNILVDRKLLDRESIRQIQMGVDAMEVSTACCRSRVPLKGLSQEGRLKCPHCHSMNSFDLREDVSRIPGKSDSEITSCLKAIVIGENKAESGFVPPPPSVRSPVAMPEAPEPPSTATRGAELSPKSLSQSQKIGSKARKRQRVRARPIKDRKRTITAEKTEKLRELAGTLEFPSLSGAGLEQHLQPYQPLELVHRGLRGPLFTGESPGQGRRAVKVFGTRDQLLGCPLARIKEQLSLWSSIPGKYRNPEHELQIDDEVVVLTRPFIDRETHLPILEQEGVGLDARLTRFRKVVEQLVDIHKAGRVHGNLKPSNIWVARDGHEDPVILVDPCLEQLTPGQSALEKWELFIQAPEHLAPELIEGEPATAASDVYALGWILYSLLTGESPFGVLSGGEILKAHREGPCASLPDPFEKWSGLHESMTAALPSDRIPDASGVLTVLDQVLAGQQSRLFKITPRVTGPRVEALFSQRRREPENSKRRELVFRARALLGPTLLVGAIGWLGLSTHQWRSARAEFDDPQRIEKLYKRTVDHAFKQARQQARQEPDRAREIWREFLLTFPDSPRDGAAKAELRNSRRPR